MPILDGIFFHPWSLLFRMIPASDAIKAKKRKTIRTSGLLVINIAAIGTPLKTRIISDIMITTMTSKATTRNIFCVLIMAPSLTFPMITPILYASKIPESPAEASRKAGTTQEKQSPNCATIRRLALHSCLNSSAT